MQPSAPMLDRFMHDAFFYADLDGFVAEVGRFVDEGVASGEAVLVATDAAKCEALRDHLGSLDDVSFVDMASVGRNPARIIPVWRDFVGDAVSSGRGARGVGEPVWPGRSSAELVECQHHETLLNVAFDDGPAWTLMCPYDVSSLPEAVLQEAMRSHPTYVVDAERRVSAGYDGSQRLDRQLADALPEPTVPVTEVAFAGDGFVALRDQVSRRARQAGVSRARLGDLALAIHELATNSVRHGGGAGLARIWQEPQVFVVEIRDTGHVGDRLAGRAKPPLGAAGGRGLWMVNQLCDLVELRTSAAGTVVRVSTDLT